MLNNIIEELQKGLVTDVLSMGDTKFMVIKLLGTHPSTLLWYGGLDSVLVSVVIVTISETDFYGAANIICCMNQSK